ncbi:MAG: nitroreductase family protein [Candidatus Bathyarchaeia archaeon]
MDTFECITSKLDVRNFSSTKVPGNTKLKILEAARLTGSGMNLQHWRFILVQQPSNLSRLAEDSVSGKWVEQSNFAVIVLTNPELGYHLIDAGRVVQDMQLAAWNFGVVSCIFTGIKENQLRKDFEIPKEMNPSVIVGFGYPANKISGKKKTRKPQRDIMFLEKYNAHFDPSNLDT